LIIKSLQINNLRNIKRAGIEAHPRVNLLIGENGAGKTTVLESMMVLAKGRSFRSNQAAALIGPEDRAFRVTAKIVNGPDRTRSLGIERSVEGWKARRDGQDIEKLGELAADLPLVLMEPNSHSLISGPPEGRRRFLDWGVFHVEHGFLGTWRRYTRAVRQRNSALRSQNGPMVKSLDPLVTDLGEQIASLRGDFFEKLAERTAHYLCVLNSELPGIDIRYRKGWSGDSLREALDHSMQRDLERGSTGVGPHRADLVLSTREKPAREVLSRGEQKALAAAMLLSQAELMADAGETPVFLLDDLASEFDDQHRSSLLSASMDTNAQVWITGTSVDPYSSVKSPERHVFHVEQGKITLKTEP
jgi:DNA replication and repair protein RecF